jgi:hypothetical protein
MRFELRTLAAIAAVIVVMIAAVLLLTGGNPTISTNRTVSLARNASYNFYLTGDKNVSSVQVVSTSAANSTIYLGMNPLLINDVVVLHLSRGQSENVSLSGSSSADLNVMLASSTSQASTLVLTYIPVGLGVRVSPGVGVLSPTGSYMPPVTTTVYNSTVQSTSTTVTAGTTTIAATTTAVQVNKTAQAIMDVNTTTTGEIINGFSRIFTNQNLECNQQIYDNEFANVYGMVATGSMTFANTSPEIPQRVSSSAISVGNGLYNITYLEVVPAGNRPFGKLQYDLSGNYIISSTFDGDFGGSYSAVFENYTAFNKTTDKCAIFGV